LPDTPDAPPQDHVRRVPAWLRLWRLGFLPPLPRYIVLRVLAAIPVMIGVTFICFTVMNAAPGDPVRIVMGQHYNEEIADQLRAKWGLDQPFVVQYGRFIGRLTHGDLGRSYVKRTEVSEYLGDKFVNTLLLTLVAMCIAVALGLIAGIVSAAWPRSPADYLMMLLAVGGISIPVFWLGLMLQLYFASNLGWFPVSDMTYSGSLDVLWSNSSSYLSYWWQAYGRHFVLPGITLATVPMAIIARLTRSSMLEVLSLDYIKTARAKGMSYRRVVLIHALKNALIPIVTVIGNNFALLLTGAVLTETVFAWPGLGRAMVDAINQYDYPVVMGGVLMMAGVFVLVNLVVDLVYGFIDPRVRYG
jgi:peptide/nickel transport system permease protein